MQAQHLFVEFDIDPHLSHSRLYQGCERIYTHKSTLYDIFNYTIRSSQPNELDLNDILLDVNDTDLIWLDGMSCRDGNREEFNVKVYWKKKLSSSGPLGNKFRNARCSRVCVVVADLLLIGHRSNGKRDMQHVRI